MEFIKKQNFDFFVQLTSKLGISQGFFFGLRYELRNVKTSKSKSKLSEDRSRSSSLESATYLMATSNAQYEWMRLEKPVLHHRHLLPDENGFLATQYRVRYFPEKVDLIVKDPITLVLFFILYKDYIVRFSFFVITLG